MTGVMHVTKFNGITCWENTHHKEGTGEKRGDILFNYGPGTQYPRVSGIKIKKNACTNGKTCKAYVT